MIPLTGIHMICVGGPGAAALTVNPGGQDCEETCARHKPETPAAAPGCVLVPDGCSLLLPGMIAVLPAYTAVSIAVAVAPLENEINPLYLSPALAHTIPPPKA
jgi:hypothetical protein